MNQLIWNEEKTAGVLLIVSMVILIFLAILLAFRPGFPYTRLISGGLEGVVDHLSTHRWLLILWVAAMFFTVLGLAIFTILLKEAGDRLLSTLALLSIGLTAVMWAIEVAFHLTVTPWAAQEFAVSGVAPPVYEALRRWVSVSMQFMYMVLAMLSIVAYGWAILNTRLIVAWVGWTAIVWGLGWLLIIFVSRTTIPAIIFPVPWIIGIALLLNG